jgi:ATP-dependent helicase/nuclease subunit B
MSSTIETVIETITSLSSAERLAKAESFLRQFADGEILILAPSRTAADEFVRQRCSQEGAVFGVHRFTPIQLAIEAAGPRLVEAGKAILGGVALDALAARAVYECRKNAKLEWFEEVARTPGFFTALAATISELRLNGIESRQLTSSGASGKDLANLLTAYITNLDSSGLADSAEIYRTGAAAIKAREFGMAKLPILFLDISPTHFLEQEFVRALIGQTTNRIATIHARDEDAIAFFGERKPTITSEEKTALDRLRRHVFEIEPPPAGLMDSTLEFISATDENRECVEITRAILSAARSGIAFDRQAVLVRNPELYQPLLEDAFRRAGIEAHFTHGTQRPNAGGRALLALLACAAEKLSASRFSEYLSLGQVPEAPQQPEWTPPQGELFAKLELPSWDRGGARRAGWSGMSEVDSEATTPALRATPPISGGESSFSSYSDPDSTKNARLQTAPRYWERLLVDAAVIGGYDRWFRRLQGLRKEFQKRIEELGAEDDAARLRLQHDIARLENLQEFALPIVKFLDELPPTAIWNEWLDLLERLTAIAIRRPEPVLSVLAELRPMGATGPVTLDEIREALTDRLTFLRTEPTERRYGKVFVSTIQEASGLAFDMVFLPGLGEDIFPRKSFEDPLLLDEQHAAISPYLTTQNTRVRRERMLLHLAASAATSRMWISYPRMDLNQGRARGPSFYALDVIRAITGAIPDLRTLQQRAVETSQSQIGWPAPRDPSVSIDDAEYDLAVISTVLRRPPSEVHGAGRYLVDASAPLARSLRARWSRWEKSWTPSDGIHLHPTDPALAILNQHRLTARAYSATALQHFAVCPYRFALRSIYHLHLRDEIAALERMDPLTRGRLFHEVQFQLLTRLKSMNLLPMSIANHASVVQIADQVLDEVQETYREDLSPAIPRVWESEVEELRWDLRGWIRQVVSAPDSSQWMPDRFEMDFDLPHLRGAIDLVEEGAGCLRITDHKTGKAPSETIQFVGRGEVLQPILYAEVAEGLLGKPAGQARLFYCTEPGGYRIIDVPINDDSRATMKEVLRLIDSSIEEGFLPAAPRKAGCQYCDYHAVCGPYEEIRVARKAAGNLNTLHTLRELR